MSNKCKVDLPTNPLPTEITRAEIIRKAMSLNNFLNKPTADLKGGEAHEPASPHDPPTCMKDEVSPPSVSSDTPVAEPVSVCIAKHLFLSPSYCTTATRSKKMRRTETKRPCVNR